MTLPREGDPLTVYGYINFEGIESRDCDDVKRALTKAVEDLGGKITAYSFNRSDFDASQFDEPEDDDED